MSYFGIGISGYSGVSGYSGTNGATGTSGFSGYSGRSGYSGTNGAAGTDGSFGGDTQPYVFSVLTTDADPGDGILKFDNVTYGDVTRIFIDLNNSDPVDITAWVDSLDDVTNSVRGRLKIMSRSDSSKFVVFDINAATTSAVGYRKLNVAYVTGNGTFDPDEPIFVTFAIAGTSGFSGTDGATGTSGFSGYSGRSGFSGTNGATGTSGFSGYSGVSGFSGVAAGGGISWTEITTPTHNMSVEEGYIANRATSITFELPGGATTGEINAIVGKGSGGWTLVISDETHVIHHPNGSTSGPGGAVSSTNRYDCVEIICIVDATEWVVRNHTGNLNIT